jgi:chromosome segregation ATPase
VGFLEAEVAEADEERREAVAGRATLDDTARGLRARISRMEEAAAAAAAAAEAAAGREEALLRELAAARDAATLAAERGARMQEAQLARSPPLTRTPDARAHVRTHDATHHKRMYARMRARAQRRAHGHARAPPWPHGRSRAYTDTCANSR